MQYLAKLMKALAGIALFATVVAGVAQAETIIWNTSHCASGFACNSSSRTFLGSDGTTTVTAKAWGMTDYGNDQLESAYLGLYSNGLGVISQEGDDHYNSHTVDNYYRYDMVSFFFSETVDLAGLFLSAYGDTDISVWIGTADVIPVLSGKSITDLDSMFGGHFDNDGSSSDRLAWFGDNREEGNFMIIAAEIGTEDYYDKFKIDALKAYSVEQPVPDAVPEPASMAIFGLGVQGLIALRRRNARAGARSFDGSAKTIAARAKILLSRLFARVFVADVCFLDNYAR